MQQIRFRLFQALMVASLTCSMYGPALAAGSIGNGGSLNTLSGVYNTSLPTLTQGQTSTIQVDSNGRIITAPSSLIFNSSLPIYSGSGVGADTVFPSSVSTSGTSLGALPNLAGQLQIHLPPGSSVSLYIAPTVAANATAAALVSETYANASGSISALDVTLSLSGQQVWVTNYINGTSTTYTSGKPVYRFL